ncbi:hypothetical protein ACTJJ0_27140 [Chitinophaga sp. 22321]|uniref:Uncharacterized protein n=1 Tax=Chitinophaga hostae TaxID=2831022 RepID=A0ABS5J6D6_9BACT|nr:hypothetical protein [Chitinophaga hostae]MBS0030788.1 hypothetical protein [Chitinophaga hostae]
MKTLQRSTFFTILLLVLTSVHHAYGAFVYQTPWRLHVLFIAVPVGILVYLLDRLMEKYPGNQVIRVSHLLAILLFPLLVIGLYEGVYNHIAKNIVFLVTGNNSFFRLLFPPPVYEIPDNLVFEFTGVLQGLVFYPLLKRFMKMMKFNMSSRQQNI